MSDPTKEYDTEREIHDAYDRLMDITTPARIERYRAAVRAETLREVRGVVEGMYLGIDTEIARGRVLDKLDTLEEK